MSKQKQPEPATGQYWVNSAKKGLYIIEVTEDKKHTWAYSYELCRPLKFTTSDIVEFTTYKHSNHEEPKAAVEAFKRWKEQQVLQAELEAIGNRAIERAIVRSLNEGDASDAVEAIADEVAANQNTENQVSVL